ncbi:MAG TPA: hypothetical protein VK419_13735 [Bryobacteraceae bacterium]|nr:hypothetical protein [Bryobacteraceae bacterium]
MRCFFILALTASLASAANWVEYKIGPFRVASNAGDKAARDRLNEMEQLRHVLGATLGKDSLGVGGAALSQLDTVWPIDVVLFSNQKEYGPHALKQPFIEGGSAMLGAWTADTPLPRDMLGALTRLFIDQNSGRMPDAIETAVCDLFSTIKTNGPKVTLGAPLPAGELPPDRLRAWAKIQMIVAGPDFEGKARIYLNNLQNSGDEALAIRNAFDMTPAKFEAAVDAYLKAAHFAAVPEPGEALNPNLDFVEKRMDQAAVDGLLAELDAGGKNFPPESARGLLAQGTRASLELAAKANPKWGEPHEKLAGLESDQNARIKELKLAAALEPRNSAYWQALAEAQTLANQYVDADKSWASAMKAAPNEAERARIHKVRLDLDEKRADYEAAEKRRIAAEQAAELQRIKNAAAAEVHAAEDAENRKLGGLRPGERPVEWWDAPEGEKVSGTLARVDCLAGGAMRLTIRIEGAGSKNNSIKLLIRDPNHLSVKSGDVKFSCGPQRTPRQIRVVYNVKADAKLDTVGEVAMVDFP